MEVTLDTIIALLGLFVGGGSGSFFTWRWLRSKSKADAAKEWQDFYQQAAEDANKRVQEDREYIRELKEERNNLREDRNKTQKRLGQLSDEFYELKRTQERQGLQIESMRPFLCGDIMCRNRQRVVMPETCIRSEGKKSEASRDIEPLDSNVL